MPTVDCPVKGFEQVKVTYPDEWKMKHLDQFWQGQQAAPKGSAPGTQDAYGAIALCEKIEGIDLGQIASLPLHYVPFFNWLRREVYGAYLEAIAIPKNS